MQSVRCFWNRKDKKTFQGKSINEWIYYWEYSTCIPAYNKMSNKTLDYSGVHSYLRHLPIRGYNHGWPEEIYELTDQCIYALYDYSKTNGFIYKNCSFEDFLKEHNIINHNVIKKQT